MSYWTPTLLTLFASISSFAANAASPYDRGVLHDRPILFFSVSRAAGPEADLSGHGHQGRYVSGPHAARTTALPNGERCTEFNGADQYFEVKNARDLSIPKTGSLTIEAWIRPDVLEFPNTQGSGYVYWLGKGASQEYEYAARMYSLTNSESPPRPSRISGYAFNLSGGLGSGSYFQDRISIGEWIFVTMVFNTKKTSSEFPSGYVKIYRDGTLRKTTSLGQFNVVPGFGAAPLRIATMDQNSFFSGAIGKVAVFDYELSTAQIAAHHRLMARAAD